MPRAHRDLVLLQGPEPSFRWRAFSAAIVELAEALGTQMVVTLGALLADVPHTRPVPVNGLSSDEGLVERLDLRPTNYEGPTGIVGVLQAACAEAGMPTASLWASVPHYVAAAPNPKAALALVRKLEALLGVAVDATELETRVGRLRAPGLARGPERPRRAGVRRAARARRRGGRRRRAARSDASSRRATCSRASSSASCASAGPRARASRRRRSRAQRARTDGAADRAEHDRDQRRGDREHDVGIGQLRLGVRPVIAWASRMNVPNSAPPATPRSAPSPGVAWS